MSISPSYYYTDLISRKEREEFEKQLKEDKNKAKENRDSLNNKIKLLKKKIADKKERETAEEKAYEKKKNDLKKELETNDDLISDKKKRIAQNTLNNDDFKKKLVLLKKSLETSRKVLKEANEAYVKEEKDNNSKLEDIVAELKVIEAKIKEANDNHEPIPAVREAKNNLDDGTKEVDNQFGNLLNIFNKKYTISITDGLLDKLTKQFIPKFKKRDISLWSIFIEKLKKLLVILNNCQNLSGKNFKTIIEEASDCVALLPGIVYKQDQEDQESKLLIDLINNKSGEFKFDIFDEGNDGANTAKDILINIKELFISFRDKLTPLDANTLSDSFTIFRNNYDIHTKIYDIADSIGANTAELNTSGITKSHWDNENFAALFNSTLTYEMGVSSREGNLNDYNKKYEEPHFFNEIKFADLSEILKELRSTLKRSIKSDVGINEVLNYEEDSGTLSILDGHEKQIKQYYDDGSNWDKTTLNNHKSIFNTVVDHCNLFINYFDNNYFGTDGGGFDKINSKFLESIFKIIFTKYFSDLPEGLVKQGDVEKEFKTVQFNEEGDVVKFFTDNFYKKYEKQLNDTIDDDDLDLDENIKKICTIFTKYTKAGSNEMTKAMNDLATDFFETFKENDGKFRETFIYFIYYTNLIYNKFKSKQSVLEGIIKDLNIKIANKKKEEEEEETAFNALKGALSMYNTDLTAVNTALDNTQLNKPDTGGVSIGDILYPYRKKITGWEQLGDIDEIISQIYAMDDKSPSFRINDAKKKLGKLCEISDKAKAAIAKMLEKNAIYNEIKDAFATQNPNAYNRFDQFIAGSSDDIKTRLIAYINEKIQSRSVQLKAEVEAVFSKANPISEIIDTTIPNYIKELKNKINKIEKFEYDYCDKKMKGLEELLEASDCPEAIDNQVKNVHTNFFKLTTGIYSRITTLNNALNGNDVDTALDAIDNILKDPVITGEINTKIGGIQTLIQEQNIPIEACKDNFGITNTNFYDILQKFQNEQDPNREAGYKNFYTAAIQPFEVNSYTGGQTISPEILRGRLVIGAKDSSNDFKFYSNNQQASYAKLNTPLIKNNISSIAADSTINAILGLGSLHSTGHWSYGEKSYLHYENDKNDAQYLRIEDLVEPYKDFLEIYANLSLVTLKTCSFDDGVEEKLKLTSENLKTNHDAVVERYNIFVTDCVDAINNTKELFEKYGGFYGTDKYETLDKDVKIFLPLVTFNSFKYNFLKFFVYSESKKFCFKKIVDEFYAHCRSCEQLIRENPQESKLSRELHEYFLDYISAYLFAHSKIGTKTEFVFNKTLGIKDKHHQPGPKRDREYPVSANYPGWNRNWKPGGGKEKNDSVSTMSVSGSTIDFAIEEHVRMNDLLIPQQCHINAPSIRESFRTNMSPNFGDVPILYYYFAIDSRDLWRNLEPSRQERDNWVEYTSDSTGKEIGRVVNKCGFNAPKWIGKTGAIKRFLNYNINNSDNIRDFFDNDAPKIIQEGLKLEGIQISPQTAANKLKPLYDTYTILKNNYKGMPITKYNICTKLEEFKGRGNKDSNIFYNDGRLLQNFAKFCLWLNWYTTEPPSNRIPSSKTDAKIEFDFVNTCFLGAATDQSKKTTPKTPDGRTCVEHDRERGWNSTKRLDRNQFLHGSTITGSSRPNSARQHGMVDRSPGTPAAGQSLLPESKY